MLSRGMATIELDRVTKRFAADVVAVDDVTLTVGDGELMVLVGPSGCGKSTLLRMVAGLEEVTAGSVRIGGDDVTDLPPRRRDVAMVFQSYALYPHMTVRENMGYGLRVRRVPRAERERRVGEVAGLLGLADLLERKPAQLSGGQRQRVAMGRAIVREPRAFLMDEPLSNLDAKLRASMRASLAQLHLRLGVTTLYVTHDQTEAMTLGQRVAVMRAGRVVQVDEPQALYAAPRNLFVAAFIGSPAMNLVEATLADGCAAFADVRLPLDPARRPRRTSGRVALGVRPEAFEHAARAPEALPRLSVRVEVVEQLGAELNLLFRVDAPGVAPDGQGGDEGGLVGEGGTLLVARVPDTTRVAPGERVTLAVDPARLHFFDLDSGESLLAGPAGDGRVAEPAAAAEFALDRY